LDVHNGTPTIYFNPPPPNRECSLTHNTQPLAAALTTLLTLLTTTIMHTISPLSPLLNLTLNGFLTFLWTPSFALLTWHSSLTLSHICNQANWDTSTGISICRLYKALFSFTLFGFISTCLALWLDVKTRRRLRRRGTFSALERNAGKRGFERPGEVQQTNPNPSVRGEGNRGGEGYMVPEEQFRYEDTGYYGAARHVEGRS
jgi:hypothetical protein